MSLFYAFLQTEIYAGQPAITQDIIYLKRFTQLYLNLMNINHKSVPSPYCRFAQCYFKQFELNFKREREYLQKFVIFKNYQKTTWIPS